MTTDEKTPFLSIILAIDMAHHLASLTLASIVAQTEKDFEIIVVETGSSKHDLQMLKEYSEAIKRVFTTTSGSHAHMFNRGLALASGEYVQFLSPGDVYLSEESLASLREAIEKQKGPDIFITSFLKRDEISQPEAMQNACSIETLKKGEIPSRLPCCFFKKKLVQSLKGFSKEVSRREGFDLFCRMLQSNLPTIGSFPRVIMDYEVQRKSPKEILLYVYETLKIIKQHFGWGSTLKWIFIYNHCRSVVWLYRSLVHYFLKSS